MAKDRHRIFEIYEDRDEAAWELMPKTGKVPNGPTVADDWTFKHLSVTRLAGITQVQFTEAKLSGHEIISQIQDDFAQLADKLNGDSRVLIDFTGVQMLSLIHI